MRNFTISLSLFLCLFISSTFAQEVTIGEPTFEGRAKRIAEKIDAITKEEKAALKLEVEAINLQLEAGTITSSEADEKKMRLAETRARNIETRTAEAEAELNQLVKDRIDGKIKDRDSSRVHKYWFEDQKKRDRMGESRTTSQLVLAGGLNNAITGGNFAHSDFTYMRSAFFEWGITFKTRILKNNNLLHFKYGLTGVYNYVTPTGNRYFVVDGDQTVLEEFPVALRKKESFFKNVFITIPLHIEFDFSKNEMRNDKPYFRTHKGFRFGIGGFVGANTNTKQYLSYEVDDYRIKEKIRGDFNVPDWNYGLSTYFGYKDTSVYLKYDLNPMFENNAVDVHNVSLGIRFDFN